MFDRLIRAALDHKGAVLIAAAALLASGLAARRRLPIDAVPDITNVQVVALTEAPALGPEEIEQFVTIPVENAMNGIPSIREVRSISQSGLSVVTVVFEEGSDLYWARQQVGERLRQARGEIPDGFGRPELGPIATGLGEVVMFEVRDAERARGRHSLMELRTILDWEVARPLRSVPGVVEVNAFGGALRTYEIRLAPERMQARGITADRVFEAVRCNNGNASGGYIQRNGEIRVIRAEGIIKSLADLSAVVLDTTPDGTPIYVRDVADVHLAPMIRGGAVTRDGRGEAATAVVLMLSGENSRVVAGRVKAKLARIQEGLPDGVEIDTFSDRTRLIDRTLATVTRGLVEGGILVVVALLASLGSLRASLIAALAIPLAMVVAMGLMLAAGIPAGLMSLGAIDLGVVVAGSAIVIENIVRHLTRAESGRSATEVVRRATLEVGAPVAFGMAIVAVVYLPILGLGGVEGTMFRPMAWPLISALSGSLLVSLTVTPVLASLLLRAGMSARESWPVRLARRAYRPCLGLAVARPGLACLAAAVAVAAGLPLARGLGGEFLPRLDEGDLLVVLTRPTDASLADGIADTTRFEKALRSAFPDEIRTIVSRTGRPEIGLDPAGVNRSDVFVMLVDPEHSPRARSRGSLIAAIEGIGRKALPGTSLSVSQPIEQRFNDLLAGVRGDVGLSLQGDDLHVLQREADALAGVLRQVPGNADVKAQVVGGLPLLRVVIDREKIARYGINAAEVLDLVSALGGKEVGQVVEGPRRFAIQVRFEPGSRNDIGVIRRLKVSDHRGRLIPLEDLAEIRKEEGTFEIRRKDRRRRVMVEANVRGRDLAGFVAEAQRRVASRGPLPRGYDLEWGGTLENLQSATARLRVVAPLALALIFLLLSAAHRSIRLGALTFLSVPLGAVGGILGLRLLGLNFSISAGVGFIALSGVAVLNGLVLVSAIRRDVEAGGEPVEVAVVEASLSRLRPVLMTAGVASLGFLPMALSQGAGAEVHRPLATVVIGGLITSTLLTLLVVPAAYPWFDPGIPIGPKDPGDH